MNKKSDVIETISVPAKIFFNVFIEKEKKYAQIKLYGRPFTKDKFDEIVKKLNIEQQPYTISYRDNNQQSLTTTITIHNLKQSIETFSHIIQILNKQGDIQFHMRGKYSMPTQKITWGPIVENKAARSRIKIFLEPSVNEISFVGENFGSEVEFNRAVTSYMHKLKSLKPQKLSGKNNEIYYQHYRLDKKPKISLLDAVKKTLSKKTPKYFTWPQIDKNYTTQQKPASILKKPMPRIPHAKQCGACISVAYPNSTNIQLLKDFKLSINEPHTNIPKEKSLDEPKILKTEYRDKDNSLTVTECSPEKYCHLDVANEIITIAATINKESTQEEIFNINIFGYTERQVLKVLQYVDYYLQTTNPKPKLVFKIDDKILDNANSIIKPKIINLLQQINYHHNKKRPRI